MAEASAIIDNSVFMTGSIVKGLEVSVTEGGSMSKRRTNHVYRRCRRWFRRGPGEGEYSRL